MMYIAYSIEVTAVNAINTGVYSDPLIVTTGSKLYYNY